MRSLDENKVRFKGRSAAKTYMKSKPVRLGVRFYAVAGWKEAYLHRIWDNWSGKKTGVSAATGY